MKEIELYKRRDWDFSILKWSNRKNFEPSHKITLNDWENLVMFSSYISVYDIEKEYGKNCKSLEYYFILNEGYNLENLRFLSKEELDAIQEETFNKRLIKIDKKEIIKWKIKELQNKLKEMKD